MDEKRWMEEWIGGVNERIVQWMQENKQCLAIATPAKERVNIFTNYTTCFSKLSWRPARHVYFRWCEVMGGEITHWWTLGAPGIPTPAQGIPPCDVTDDWPWPRHGGVIVINGDWRWGSCTTWRHPGVLHRLGIIEWCVEWCVERCVGYKLHGPFK